MINSVNFQTPQIQRKVSFKAQTECASNDIAPDSKPEESKQTQDLPSSESMLKMFSNFKTLSGKIIAKSPAEQTKDTINEFKNFTFDDINVPLIKDKYNKRNIYNLGLQYAMLARNTELKTGTALLKNEVPAIFEGIELNDLTNELNKLPQALREARTICHKTQGEINICGKKYNWEWLGRGMTSTAYKLTDDSGNAICFKYSNRFNDVPGMEHGIFDEAAILNEANKAGVKDVPKLYMANLLGRRPGTGINREVEGCWQLIEYIDKDTVPPQGLTLCEWLKSKGLVHTDLEDNPNNRFGGYAVDLGGIRQEDCYGVDMGVMENVYENIFDRYCPLGKW